MKRPDTLCFTEVVRMSCKAYLITSRSPKCTSTTCIIIHKISVPIIKRYQGFESCTHKSTKLEKMFHNLVYSKATVCNKYEKLRARVT